MNRLEEIRRKINEPSGDFALIPRDDADYLLSLLDKKDRENERLRADLDGFIHGWIVMATLEEIENNNRAEKSRRKIAGLPDKRWMEEIDWLIAEIKRLLRRQLENEHVQRGVPDSNPEDYDE